MWFKWHKIQDCTSEKTQQDTRTQIGSLMNSETKLANKRNQNSRDESSMKEMKNEFCLLYTSDAADECVNV